MTAPRPVRVQSFRGLVIYLCLGAVALSTVSAFGWVINSSLKTDTEFLATSPWALARDPAWGNYANAWENARIGVYFGNSVLVSVAATVLGVVVAAFAAYPVARIPFRFNGLVLTLFLLGLMVPWMVTFIPLHETVRDLGLLDSRVGLVLVYATYNLPFNVFVLAGFLRTLPRELEEQAAVDGAGPTRTFLRIIVPLLGPGLASVAVISFLQNWNEFFYALVLIDTTEKMTLPWGLFSLGQDADYNSDWVTLFAGMMITVVPVLLVFAVMQRHITKGLTAGALK
jgi:ABC-type glycerol-3-phosphate transport system permease component